VGGRTIAIFHYNMEQLANVAMARLNLITEDGLKEVISTQVQDLIEKMVYSCKAFDGTQLPVSPELLQIQLCEYWGNYGLGKWNVSQLQTVWRALKEEVDDYVNVISDFAKIHFRRSFSLDDMTHARNILYILSLTGQIAGTMKILVNLIFARHYRTEKPDIPKDYLGQFLLPRWMNNIFRRMSVRARSKNSIRDGAKVYSFFQGLKKGFLPIRPDAIDKSLIKHKEALTKDPSCDEEILDYMEEVLEKEFQHIPNKLLKTWRCDKEPCMSAKSTCESSMGSCGQVGFAHVLNNLSDRYVRYLAYANDEDRRAFTDDLSVILQPQDQFQGYFSVKGDQFGYDRSKVMQAHSVVNYMTDYEIREQLQYFRSLRAAFGKDEENFRVQPAVVLEPMKGRIITKPAVGTYINWGRLQKTLWRELRKYDQFQLVGRPVEEEDIWHVAGSYQIGMGFNSGDFSGATDNLKGSVSSTILRFLLNRLPLEEVLRIERSFCNSAIDYRKDPVRYEKDELGAMYKWKCTQQGIVEQRNGQLMGHILSFPILCIANYLIFKYTYERVIKRPIPNVRVNGDDILFLLP